MQISKHFQADRADRYAFIATNVGVGTIICSHKQKWSKYPGEPCTVSLTNTGVAIVHSAEGVLITMYVMTLQEAQRFFVSTSMPMVLEAIIKQNMKRKYHILQNEVIY